MADKACTKCGEVKPHNEFGAERRNRDGLRSHCKLCCVKSSRRYKKANRELVKNQRAMYRDANRDVLRERGAEYRASNLDQLRERDRKHQQARRLADPFLNRLALGARRANKLGCLIEGFTGAELLDYWQAVGIDPSRCYYTGELLDDGWHLDHMTPLSRGGSHSVDNLAPCTAAVNNSKHDQTAEEYLNVLRAA